MNQKDVVLFKSGEKKNLKEVVDFLRQLAVKLDEGQVVLRQREESLTGNIPDHVVLEIKAEE